MGHLRLGSLPLYKNWKQVVAALEDHSKGLKSVAALTAKAAQRKLSESASSPYVWYPYWLLIQLAHHGRDSEAFRNFLDQQGIFLECEESAVTLVSALTRALEEQRGKFGPPNALDELAVNSFRKVLVKVVLSGAGSLFDSALEEARRAFAQFGPSRAFGKLSRIYLGTYYGEVLSYFLSYELGKHVGENRRFNSHDEAERFSQNIERYAHQVSALIEDFASGWHSKRLWEQGEISQEDARRFLHVAFQKYQQQLDLEIDRR